MSDDWLYGGRSPRGRDSGRKDPESPQPPDPDATRPVPRQPEPDETRVMPTVSRSGEATPRRSGHGAAPVSPLPPTTSKTGGGGGFGDGVRRTLGRVPKPGFKLRYLWLLLVLWLVYLVAVPFFAWSKVDKINAFPGVIARPTRTAPTTCSSVATLAPASPPSNARSSTPATPPASAPTPSCSSTTAADPPSPCRSHVTR